MPEAVGELKSWILENGSDAIKHGWGKPPYFEKEYSITGSQNHVRNRGYLNFGRKNRYPFRPVN